MEKVLSQSEIDALFRAASGKSAEVAVSEMQVEPWDFRAAGLLNKEQLHSISQIHETFARNLSGALSAYLRESFEVKLVAVEQLAYRDLLLRFPAVNYYSTFHLLPVDARGLLHLDLNVALPLVDILLGGLGTPVESSRGATAIEESVLQGVGQAVCKELAILSTPLGMQIQFEACQPYSQMIRLMRSDEKTLTLTFDIFVAKSQGMLNIVLPSVVSSAILRKLRAELVYEGTQGPATHQESIGRRLLHSRLQVELDTPAIAIRVSDLLAMREGRTLPLRQSIKEPGVLRIRGRACWSAHPVSRGHIRAAQVVQRLTHRHPEVTES